MYHRLVFSARHALLYILICRYVKILGLFNERGMTLAVNSNGRRQAQRGTSTGSIEQIVIEKYKHSM